MNITYLRSIVLKLLAPIGTLLFLLMLTASPALAKAGKIKEFIVRTAQSSSSLSGSHGTMSLVQQRNSSDFSLR